MDNPRLWKNRRPPEFSYLTQHPLVSRSSEGTRTSISQATFHLVRLAKPDTTSSPDLELDLDSDLDLDPTLGPDLDLELDPNVVPILAKILVPGIRPTPKTSLGQR